MSEIMNQEMQERLTQIFNDESIMKKISMSESLPEMQAVFSENGVDFSIEEVQKFVDFMNASSNGDLTENDLDQVAGGAGAGPTDIFGWAWEGIKRVAKPCWEAGRWFARQGW